MSGLQEEVEAGAFDERRHVTASELRTMSPASVLALHAPQRLTSPNEKRKAPPPPAPVRHSSLTISEPLDVTINGVSVARDRPPRL